MSRHNKVKGTHPSPLLLQLSKRNLLILPPATDSSFEFFILISPSDYLCARSKIWI